MGRIQIKRMWRYLWANRARYFGLFLLTAIVVSIVVTLISTSDTVISGKAKSFSEERPEDGQFSLFVPLSEQSAAEIEQTCGVALEEHFYFDITDADKTVRIFQERKEIDRVTLLEGRTPERADEIVLEQIFVSENNLSVGDRFEVYGRAYTICGYGSIPDYGLSLCQPTDLTAHFDSFTWAILTDEAYDEIKAGADKTEEYIYAYRFTGQDHTIALRQAIGKLDPDYTAYAASHPGFEAFMTDQIRAYKMKIGLNPEKSFYESLTEQTDALESVSNQLDGKLVTIRTELAPPAERLGSGHNLSSSERAEVKSALVTTCGEAASLCETVCGYINLLIKTELLDTKETGDLTILWLKLSSQTATLSGLSAGAKPGLPRDFDTQKQMVDSAILAADTIRNLISDRSDFFMRVREMMNEQFSDVNAEIRIALRRYIAKESTFTEVANNSRMNDYLDYAYLYRNAGYACGVLLLGLLSLIFAVMTSHQMKRESSVIGTQYALGVPKKVLMGFYLSPALAVAVLGGAAGLLIGYSPLLSSIPTRAFHIINSFPYYSSTVSPLLILYALLAPVAVSLAVHLAVLKHAFSHTVLEMLHETDGKFAPTKGMNLKHLPFTGRFCLRQIRREYGAVFIVVIGVAMSLVLLMLGLNTRILTKNAREKTVSEMGYRYLYILRYPTENLDCGSGERIYLEQLSTVAYGTGTDVTIVGVGANSQHFVARPIASPSHTVISEALATKTGATVGSNIIFTDRITGRSYAFVVDGIVQSGANLECYLDLDIMRQTFGQTQNFYNAVVSDSPLSIDSRSVLSVGTQEDILSGFAYEEQATLPFTLFAITASLLLFLVVLYLVLGMMIDRNTRGISLLRIFGFSPTEIETMYVLGILILTLLSLAVAIPLSKIGADVLCRYIYSRLPIGGFYTYPAFLYPIVFLVAAASMALILWLLLSKVKKTDYRVILKDLS